METVTTCFTLRFSSEQFLEAKEYVEDMKRHRQRVFWAGKENTTDEQLIYSVIAHRILSGFYNINQGKYGSSQILAMNNQATA